VGVGLWPVISRSHFHQKSRRRESRGSDTLLPLFAQVFSPRSREMFSLFSRRHLPDNRPLRESRGTEVEQIQNKDSLIAETGAGLFADRDDAASRNAARLINRRPADLD